jgi:hypothetical protein
VSSRADVLLWAQRVTAKRAAAAHDLLEVRPGASVEDAQEAFHRIARIAHPDLHRNHLSAEDLELVTRAYALVAGAYQTLRSQVTTTQRSHKPDDDPDSSSVVPVTPGGPAPQLGAAATMSSRALVYYRKAELALKRGDLKGAILQLKLAIAADPQSGFLRSALAEVDAEVRKGT